ncbi:hypothetical protein P8452_36310 [Trifolium repens]|nr:hypothetical protein P8452_36310 [Trifolium repens]
MQPLNKQDSFEGVADVLLTNYLSIRSNTTTSSSKIQNKWQINLHAFCNVCSCSAKVLSHIAHSAVSTSLMHRRRPIGHLRHEILIYARIKHKLFIVSIMKMKTFLKKSVNTNQEIIKSRQ